MSIVIARLTTQWQEEQHASNQRSFKDTDYVYVWVDGIHLKVRLEQDKVCLLVILGVRADGTKELVALADGFRESSESRADLLRSCKRRGMQAPVLAVGDGALGFWKAVREVFPETKEQRCRWHRMGNVLAALPKSAHPGAKAAMAEIYDAQDRKHAQVAAKAFEIDYGAKWPKAVAKITEGLDTLLAFYDFTAEHWIHLRTTNPIEAAFATVRLRQRVTEGPGSRAAGVAMAFKLISLDSATPALSRSGVRRTRRFTGGRAYHVGHELHALAKHDDAGVARCRPEPRQGSAHDQLEREVGMDRRLYAKVVGVVIVLIGIGGLILGEKSLLDVLNIDIVEDIIHLVTGGLMVAVGFRGSDSAVRNVVGGLGVVYLVVGVLGFFVPDLFGLLPSEYTVVDNVIHLLLGVLGIAVGYVIGRPADSRLAT